MERRTLRGRKLFITVAIVGAFLAGGATYGAVVNAGASGTNTTYYACLSSGSLAQVGTTVPKCSVKSAKVISWNSVGPQGPPGPACGGIPHVGIDLAGCDLAGADLTGNFTDANLSHADLVGASIAPGGGKGGSITSIFNGTNFTGDNLAGLDFSSLNLGKADLADENLSNHDLTNTTLTNADLDKANLTNADLSAASLDSANLTDADLQDATLGITDFSDANLTDASLAGATYPGMYTPTFTGTTWSNTICPDGTNSNDDGGTCVNNLTP